MGERGAPSRPPRPASKRRHLNPSEKVPQMAARSETSRSRPTGISAAWQALEDHHATMRGRHLRDLFADDPARGERMTAEAAGIFLDYSKNRITDETLKLLVATGGTMRAARANRRDVSRREDQRHRESRRPARRAARAERRVDRRRWQERRAGGSRRARQDGRLREPRPQRRSGKATPASASATSSTSASAAPTSGR